MNATLQSFSNIDILTNHFFANINNEDYNKKDLVKEYMKVIKNLWNIEGNLTKKYYEPYDFKNKISQKNPQFSGIAANDSKDLILFILEELHKELNEHSNINNKDNQKNNNITSNNANLSKEKKEYNQFKDDYYSKNSSIIQKTFYGELESFTHCNNCDVNLYNFSIFNFLIFPLEKIRQYLINNGKYGNQIVSLTDCFDNFISEEIMTGSNKMYCNNCNQTCDFSTYAKIYKHPEILILILNRGQGLQYNVPFTYSQYLTLNNYINLQDNDNYKNNNSSITYELISVIAHIGDSSMSGHFIACCKSPVDQKFYIYNDAFVSECNNPLSFTGDSNSNSIPYVLFYQIIKSLYFQLCDGKQLYINVKDYMTFEDVIDLLNKNDPFEKEKYTYIRKRGNKNIDISKTIKENDLENEEIIILQKKN